MLPFSTLHKMDLQKAVYLLVSQIPSGYVLGYGHVATFIGRPNHARHVGFALSALPANTNIRFQENYIFGEFFLR